MRIPFAPSLWPLLAVVSLSCSSEIGGNGVTGVGVSGSPSSSATGTSDTPSSSTAQTTSQTNTNTDASGASTSAVNGGAAAATGGTGSGTASGSTSTGGDGAGLGSAGNGSSGEAAEVGGSTETSNETSSPPLTEQEQAETEDEGMPPAGMSMDDEAASETGGGAGGMSGETSTDPLAEACTDIPDPEQSCQQRFDWGNCEQQWMIDGGFCNRTCGRCTGDGGGDTGGGDNGGGGDTGGGDNGGGSTVLGDDNPYPSIAGSPQGNSTRYWDCCKQSCGWAANASQPVDSCDYQGNNIGANDQDKNVCFENGRATTCHGMAPWARSTKVAYGYAAANGAGCGTCWQLEFTGTSSNGGNDQGSAAIAGKTMIVMATNIGDLNGQLHFDLLIPGGGLGLNNGCTASLGIPADQLGANRGGFLTSCASAGDHNAKKECVRNSCTSVFGSRGLSDLEAGCLWFVDWFEIADNPNFFVKQVDCPQELRQFN